MGKKNSNSGPHQGTPHPLPNTEIDVVGILVPDKNSVNLKNSKKSTEGRGASISAHSKKSTEGRGAFVSSSSNN